ncbi:DNA replication complex GINS protein PSF2 [Balamuthia mandrillaris]
MQGKLSNSQIEFLSENELITVIPRFSLDTLQLISGDFGPFMASVPAKVPLWLALALKKRQMCTIVAPEWLSVAHLEKVLKQERDELRFQAMPFHYMEIASQLFNSAAEDIKDCQQVQSLLEDIWNARFLKNRNGLEALQINNLIAVKSSNLSALEINYIRQLTTPVFDQLQRLLKVRDGEELTSSSATSGLYSQSQSQSESAPSSEPPPRKLRRR